MLNSGCGSTSSASLREAVVRSIDGLQHADLARLRRHSLYQFEQLRDRVLVLHDMPVRLPAGRATQAAKRDARHR